MDRFEEVKQRVKEANDLVAVIESYVPLRTTGRNVTALCPFHQEKTPSFTVYPDSQHFKCYGCGKAGDVFTFIMDREGLSFREAFELLAQRAAISIEGVFGSGRRDSSSGPKVDPYAILAQVQEFFAETLRGPEGQRARDYLVSRGLDRGIEEFGIGAHPTSNGALRRFAQAKKLPFDVLEHAGLLGRDGREPFFGRLMFAIEDERGRIVGFGGRLLGEGRAKYINSPESPFFLKRKVLYGLRRTKQAGERRIVVVEGYTDVIACHLAGFRGAVATLGTAFTPDHGRALARYATDGVVLLFDGDRAGCAAAEKAYGELAGTDLVARIALLPEGTDPADLLSPRPDRPAAELESATAQFTGVLESAEDALAMWFRLKRSRLDMTQDAIVAQVVGECGHVLDRLEDPTRRGVLLGRMARQLGVDERAMRKTLTSRRAPRRREPEPQVEAVVGAERAPDRPSTPIDKADLEMLACVLARPALAGAALDEPTGDPRIRELLEFAGDGLEHGSGNQDALLSYMFTRCAGEGQLGRLLARSHDLAASIKDPEQTLRTLQTHRRAFFGRQAAQKIRYELQVARDAGDQARVDELTRQYLSRLREQQFG